MTLPAPALLDPRGFSRYTSWYPGQAETWSRLMEWLSDPDPRFCSLEAPTGSGKSLIEMFLSTISGKRVVILTQTKALQDQLRRDFSHISRDVRGQNAYICVADAQQTVETGACHLGFACPYRNAGCTYYDSLTAGRDADILVTNYINYMTLVHHTEDGVGDRDLLILDEAHLALTAVESFMSTTFQRPEIERLMGDWPSFQWEADVWKAWAEELQERADASRLTVENAIKQSGGNDTERREVRHLKDIASRANTVANAKGEWACEVYSGDRPSVTFAPIWPTEYVRPILYGDMPKVLLMSATLSGKAIQLLDVPEEAPFYFAASTFPPENTPVTHIDSIRLRFNSTPEELQHWVDRIDQLLAAREDRKGLIFTVSYARRDFLIQRSRYSSRMYTHGSRDLQQRLAEFRAAPPGAVMVSPSIVSGHDLPYDDCEYIIIGKIPYPDSRGAIAKARKKRDKDYDSFKAMETLVQVSGRGTRSVEDRCEVFIVDDNWKWFNKKYAEYQPLWFKRRIQWSNGVMPTPPPKIEVAHV